MLRSLRQPFSWNFQVPKLWNYQLFHKIFTSITKFLYSLAFNFQNKAYFLRKLESFFFLFFWPSLLLFHISVCVSSCVVGLCFLWLLCCMFHIPSCHQYSLTRRCQSIVLLSPMPCGSARGRDVAERASHFLRPIRIRRMTFSANNWGFVYLCIQY